MTMKKMMFALLCLVSTVLQARPFEEWTDVQGRVMRAELLSATGTHAYFLKDWDIYEVPLTFFSAETRRYICDTRPSQIPVAVDRPTPAAKNARADIDDERMRVYLQTRAAVDGRLAAEREEKRLQKLIAYHPPEVQDAILKREAAYARGDRAEGDREYAAAMENCRVIEAERLRLRQEQEYRERLLHEWRRLNDNLERLGLCR